MRATCSVSASSVGRLNALRPMLAATPHTSSLAIHAEPARAPGVTLVACSSPAGTTMPEPAGTSYVVPTMR